MTEQQAWIKAILESHRSVWELSPEGRRGIAKAEELIKQPACPYKADLKHAIYNCLALDSIQRELVLEIIDRILPSD